MAADYTVQTQSVPAMVTVTFLRVRPTSQQAEAALRKCIGLVTSTQFLTSELQGFAFWSTTGDKDDGEVVPLADGSSYLLHDPATKTIQSSNARSGATATITDAKDRSYFVSYEETTRLVPPNDKFATISIVFRDNPTERRAFEVLIEEAKAAIQRRGSNRIDLLGFVQVGRKGNEAGWEQVRGANGKFIGIEYRPSKGHQLTADGRSLGPSAVVPP